MEQELHVAVHALTDPIPDARLVEKVPAWRLDNKLARVCALQLLLTYDALSLTLVLDLSLSIPERLHELFELFLFLGSPLVGRVNVLLLFLVFLSLSLTLVIGWLTVAKEPETPLELVQYAVDDHNHDADEDEEGNN